MAFSKTGLVAVSLAALLAAGCSSTRFSSMNEQPAPLQPAPSGNVTASTTLPPPAAPGTADRRPASRPPPAPRPTSPRSRPIRAASAPDITTGNVVGVWNASVSGQSCQVTTSQTKFGASYRAASAALRRSGQRREIWNVAGKQLSLYDESGVGRRPALFVGSGKIRWTDLDRIAYLALQVDRAILPSSPVTDAPA